MEHTIPSMQSDLNVLITGLATTTEMLDKLIPTETEIQKYESEQDKDASIRSLLLIILRHQVQINQQLVERMKLKYADAELQATLSQIDTICNKYSAY